MSTIKTTTTTIRTTKNQPTTKIHQKNIWKIILLTKIGKRNHKRIKLFIYVGIISTCGGEVDKSETNNTRK